MANDDFSGPLTVGCDCGRWIAVEPGQAGTVVDCKCCRRVVVPLLDEFRERPDQPSAPTIERRIFKLVAAGDLPPVGSCARCGKAGTTEVVDIRVDCERGTARTVGGFRFLILPLPSALFWMSWREEERVELRGRNTSVPAPLCLCAACQHHLRGRAGRAFLLAALAAITVSVSIGLAFVSVAVGIGVAAACLIAVGAWRYAERRCTRRETEQVLRRVPAYRQVFDRYPRAVGEMPPE